MRQSFKVEKDNAISLLLEYAHLIEYDQIDCSPDGDQAGNFTCWFRSYGCSILCLILIAIVSATSFKAVIGTKKSSVVE